MRVRIKAVVMDGKTRRFITEKYEEIDTNKNNLYLSVNDLRTYDRIYAIEHIYEGFWNTPIGEETIKVIDIKVLESNGENNNG